MDSIDEYPAILRTARASGTLAVGILETVRALERRAAHLVFVANDIDDSVPMSHVLSLAARNAVPTIGVPTRGELGRLAGIQVGATAVAVVDFGHDIPIKDIDLSCLIATWSARRTLANLDRVEVVLRFAEKFVEYITSGEKQGTLRMGRRVPVSGSLPLMAMPASECFGTAIIVEVGWLAFRDVAERPDILAAEWPHSYTDIRNEMQRIYSDKGFKDDSIVTYYRFSYEEERTTNGRRVTDDSKRARRSV